MSVAMLAGPVAESDAAAVLPTWRASRPDFHSFPLRPADRADLLQRRLHLAMATMERRRGDTCD